MPTLMKIALRLLLISIEERPCRRILSFLTEIFSQPPFNGLIAFVGF